MWQNQQAILFNKDTDFDNLRIFTICLLFEENDKVNFSNEIFVHIGNDIAFSLNNINWYNS